MQKATVITNPKEYSHGHFSFIKRNTPFQIWGAGTFLVSSQRQLYLFRYFALRTDF